MGKSPYPAVRIPVDYSQPLPGAPRERTSRLSPSAPTGRARHLRDSHTASGVNSAAGHVWGSNVAPVTGRKARRQPGWRSDVAGGSHIVAPGV